MGTPVQRAAEDTRASGRTRPTGMPDGGPPPRRPCGSIARRPPCRSCPPAPPRLPRAAAPTAPTDVPRQQCVEGVQGVDGRRRIPPRSPPPRPPRRRRAAAPPHIPFTMRAVHGRAVAAAAVAAVATAAAAASPAAAAVAAGAAAASSIPFPSPPPGPEVGRFHTLPALRCWLHPPRSDGASPDPRAVASPAAGGSTGWVLRANDSAPPVCVPYAPGTCASPLADTEQLEYLAAPAEADIPAPRGWEAFLSSTNVTSGGDVAAEFEWAGNPVHAFASIAATLHRPAAGEVASEWFRPHPCGGARKRPGQGLVCEDEVARLLTLHRNQRFGQVKRHAGLFDVLSMTRMTDGMALDEHPTVVAPWDAVSTASSAELPSLLMYTPRTGQTRPVLVGEAALLSLGCGIMVDPSWLGDSFPGGLNARVEFEYGRRGGALRTT